MSEIVAQKKCNKCKTVKPCFEFYKNKGHKDGFSSLCKTCVDTSNRSWENENPEKTRSYIRKWRDSHKEEEIERIKKYKKDHKEKVRASARKYTNKNSEKINSRSREYYKEHAKEKSDKEKTYRANNPGKNTEYWNNRRARKIGNGGSVTEKEWHDLKNKYSHTCLCCKKTDVKLTMDHVIPLCLGGKHIIENIQPLCGSCNSSKHTKTTDYRPKEKV